MIKNHDDSWQIMINHDKLSKIVYVQTSTWKSAIAVLKNSRTCWRSAALCASNRWISASWRTSRFSGIANPKKTSRNILKVQPLPFEMSGSVQFHLPARSDIRFVPLQHQLQIPFARQLWPHSSQEGGAVPIAHSGCEMPNQNVIPNPSDTLASKSAKSLVRWNSRTPASSCIAWNDMEHCTNTPYQSQSSVSNPPTFEK